MAPVDWEEAWKAGHTPWDAGASAPSLHTLLGRATVAVNSLHGQGVARLAEGLVVEALADDGLVEAFRADGAPGFNLAVQWHPEWRATDNEFSMAMFKAFGEACRQRAAERSGAT